MEWNSDYATINSTDCYEEEGAFTSADGIVAGAFASSFAFAGTILNGLTILALLNFERTRVQQTTPFVISLSASDLIFSSVTLPALASKFFAKRWIIGDGDGFGCKIFPLFFYGNSAVTLFSLMSVTIHRLFTKCKCLKVSI